MSRLLLVNPRSGSAQPNLDELLEAARAVGVQTHVLEPGDDAGEIAAAAAVTALGVAGGDGSLAAVAEAAIRRDLPFACIPFGTRNHFARDAGLDPDDPVAALAAFDGVERRIDVGRVGDRVFLNNVSLGAYAHLVHRRERGRRREALAGLRALGIALRRPRPFVVLVNGERRRVAVLLVGNNEYRLDVLSLGARERLDEGALVVYYTERLFPWHWAVRHGARFELDTGPGTVSAAVDGEPVELECPVEVRIEPLRLRLLQPRG